MRGSPRAKATGRYRLGLTNRRDRTPGPGWYRSSPAVAGPATLGPLTNRLRLWPPCHTSFLTRMPSMRATRSESSCTLSASRSRRLRTTTTKAITVGPTAPNTELNSAQSITVLRFPLLSYSNNTPPLCRLVCSCPEEPPLGPTVDDQVCSCPEEPPLGPTVDGRNASSADGGPTVFTVFPAPS